MAEQGNGGHTPPAFAFMDEATAGTNREGGECALGTSDDYPPYVDEYIDDVWKVLNSQNDATDVNDATDSTSTNHAPAESSASAHHFRPSTSYAGVEKVSSTTEDTASGIDVTIIAGFMRTPGVTRRTRKPRRLPKKLATSMVSLTMAALVTCTWRPSAASITQGPAQAVLAWRMHQPVLKTVPRFPTTPCATRATRSTRPRPMRLATSTVPLTMAAQVSRPEAPSGASIKQCPTQVVLAQRKHQQLLKTAPRMLPEPEKGNSENFAGSVAMFAVDRMPYTGTPRNTRMTQRPFAKHVINPLGRCLRL
ncbi:uncharacterized protein [Dermacentor albipictus]|uniref:uncharacterized protein isoform X3 n=1 Tax=Dermacentor albipictus TaxID=60249 RepID=UPI0038FC5606